MLVLSRQRDEVIDVIYRSTGKPIGEIQVVDIRGDKVRLGVTLPQEFVVHRREVTKAIERERAVEATGPQQVALAAAT